MKKKARRPVGTGSLFRPRYVGRDGKRRESRFWWIAYSVGGKLHREGTGTADKEEAEQLLRARLLARDAGSPGPSKLTLADMASMIRADYQVNGKNVRYIETRLAHLERFFGADFLVRGITAEKITAFVAEHHGRGFKPATINRSLAVLRRMFTLARRADRVQTIPAFSMLRENNARKGFLEQEALDAILAHLPEWARPPVQVAYFTGWRIDEILSRQWRHVDFQARRLRLEPGETKNREGRTFPLYPDLLRVLKAQREATRGTLVPWVFPRDGRPVSYQQLGKEWRLARVAAGHPGKLIHDFRRTKVRNMERAGVPRVVAMKLIGHKTETIYRRYFIADESMIEEAGEKMGVFELSLKSGEAISASQERHARKKSR